MLYMLEHVERNDGVKLRATPLVSIADWQPEPPNLNLGTGSKAMLEPGQIAVALIRQEKCLWIERNELRRSISEPGAYFQDAPPNISLDG